MKRILITCLSLICSLQVSFGQIDFLGFGKVAQEGQTLFRDIPPNRPIEEVKDTSLQKVMLGFRNTDINSISEYLSPSLCKEVGKIDSLLDIHEQKYNSKDSVFLQENLGVTIFSNKEIGDLWIEYYFYMENRKPLIYGINVNGVTFPGRSDVPKRIYNRLRLESLSPQESYNLYQELIDTLTVEITEKCNNPIPKRRRTELSNSYGNLSWFALNLGKNKEAVKAARKGLELNPSNVWINTNLALGLAQLGEIEEAKAIYTKFKDVIWRDETLKDFYLIDIQEVEKNGIEIKYKDKIVKLINSFH